MSVRWFIYRSHRLNAIRRPLNNLLFGRGWGGFQGDRIYRGMIAALLDTLPITSFVETGTFRGYSTEFVACRRPQLPVYTSEISGDNFAIAQKALADCKNVTPIKSCSDEFVAKLLAENKLGSLPLFFLDAHWNDYWPLRKELDHIARAGIPAVIVIDDFEVPEQPQFGFDIDGGAETSGRGEKCNLDYIRPSLATDKLTYSALFPRYIFEDGFGRMSLGYLRGHIALFQNAADAYRKALEHPLLRQRYTALDRL